MQSLKEGIDGRKPRCARLRRLRGLSAGACTRDLIASVLFLTVTLRQTLGSNGQRGQGGAALQHLRDWRRCNRMRGAGGQRLGFARRIGLLLRDRCQSPHYWYCGSLPSCSETSNNLSCTQHHLTCDGTKGKNRMWHAAAPCTSASACVFLDQGPPQQHRGVPLNSDDAILNCMKGMSFEQRSANGGESWDDTSSDELCEGFQAVVQWELPGSTFEVLPVDGEEANCEDEKRAQKGGGECVFISSRARWQEASKDFQS